LATLFVTFGLITAVLPMDMAAQFNIVSLTVYQVSWKKYRKHISNLYSAILWCNEFRLLYFYRQICSLQKLSGRSLLWVKSVPCAYSRCVNVALVLTKLH